MDRNKLALVGLSYFAGGLFGFALGELYVIHRTKKHVEIMTTLGTIFGDIVVWAEEAVVELSYSDFLNQFREKLEYLAIVANELE